MKIKKLMIIRYCFLIVFCFFVIMFEKSIILRNAYSQNHSSAINNVDEALKFYLNKYPPSHPKGTKNSYNRIKLKDNVTDDDLQYLIFFKNLRTLYVIKSKQVTDEGLKYIENLTNIEYLNLWGTNITIKGLQKLSKLKKIKGLDLDDTNIVDDDLRTIVELFPNLEGLGLGGNKIKGPGIPYLKKLRLNSLGLDNTLISDETVKYFAGFKNCEISLHNTKVTAKGKAEIMRITESCYVSIKEGDLAPPKE